MKKLVSKMKLFHLILLSLAGLVILSALPFKTQYSNIYINIGDSIDKAGSSDVNPSLGEDQSFLFDLFTNLGTHDGQIGNKEFVDNEGNVFGYDFHNYKGVVFAFENDLNALNTYLLWFGIVAIIGVTILYIFGNNSRRIYYKSNVISNAFFTIAMLVMGVIFLINSFSMMGRFSQDSNLFNYVSVLQNPDVKTQAYKAAIDGDLQYVKGLFDCNVLTLVIYDIFVGLFMVYVVFMFILSMTKYKMTSERRKELEKVVAVND